MVVGSSTAFAGVFTYHADGFVVVFFFLTIGFGDNRGDDFGGRAGATGGGATGSTLKLTFFFVEPFSAFVFSAVAFFGRRTAGEAVGLDGLKVAFVVGVDTASHTAVVVGVFDNNGASLSVVS